jgi:hypothetical protein
MDGGLDWIGFGLGRILYYRLAASFVFVV